jgi:hypothetical protein
VTITPPSDTGGAPITHYKVDWDVLGAEAYDLGYLSNPAKSLLYSPYEVQVVNSKAADYSLDGYFYLSFGGFSTGQIAVTALAEDLDAALRALPSVGDVRVVRSEDKVTPPIL